MNVTFVKAHQRLISMKNTMTEKGILFLFLFSVSLNRRKITVKWHDNKETL